MKNLRHGTRQEHRIENIPVTERVAAERAVLRHLCRNGIRSIPREGLAELSRYSWASADHRILFEALVRLGNIPTVSLRERLGAEATRMGFPDIDWESLFGVNENEPKPQSETPEWIVSLVRSLTAGT
jgi:hypothetical protein